MKFIKTGLCELIIAMTLVGCAFDPKQKAEVELENSILELNNEILKEEIIRYVKEVNIPNITPKYPYLTINDLGADTVEYHINYFVSPDLFEYNPIAFFIEVNDMIIPVEIKGLMFKNEFPFQLKREVVDEFIKIYFPEDFKYYQRHNNYPPPPTTREVFWILTFKNNQLIEKRVVVN